MSTHFSRVEIFSASSTPEAGIFYAKVSPLFAQAKIFDIKFADPELIGNALRVEAFKIGKANRTKNCSTNFPRFKVE
jgi:hypothetical protein